MGLYGGTVNAIAPHPNDPNTLFACTNGGLFKTSNAGVSWSRLSTGLPLACGAVAVGPSNGDHIYTADIGYASLAASTDEGMTWTIEPLPDIFFNAAHSGTQGLLIVDPLNSGTLFVQTASSLVESKDGGGTWTNVGGTLSPVASLLLAKNVVALDIGNVAVLQDELPLRELRLLCRRRAGRNLHVARSPDVAPHRRPDQPGVRPGHVDAAGLRLQRVHRIPFG